MSFVELFNPNQLQKLFTKRDSKQQVDENKIISNNQEGLYNYLTAPNIRHKVKHPLFLSVKFSNSFKILYNSKSKFFTQKQVTVKYFSICIVGRSHQKIAKETNQINWQREAPQKEFEYSRKIVCNYFEFPNSQLFSN